MCCAALEVASWARGQRLSARDRRHPAREGDPSLPWKIPIGSSNATVISNDADWRQVLKMLATLEAVFQ